MNPSASKAAAKKSAKAAADAEERDSLRAVSKSFKNSYRSLRRLRGRETHLLGGEISHAQFELLIELRDHGPLAAGELAHVAGLSGASVSQMVDRLADDGHVERIRSDEDRRVVKVQLSDQGRRSIEPTIAVWRERWEEAFEGVSDRELRAASKVLDRIAAVFQEREKSE